MSQEKWSNKYPIVVNDVCKYFRVYKDKSHTLKDRVLAHRRSRYKYNKVLDHVSFRVRRGEVLGLIGHNGCGKSTTLKLLNKILYPESGDIRMEGRISSLIELGAGFHPDMTGRENIYINASIFGLHRSEIDRRIQGIIQFSELEAFIDNPVRTYSSGMYMRLAFAIAINVDADILLVDEILAVGDVSFQKKCFDKLREIKDHGATIVIVSHDMQQIKNICDRVIWLDGGHIKEQGDAVEVCEDYLLEMRNLAEQRKVQESDAENEQINPGKQYPPSELGTQISKYVRRDGDMKARFSSICLLNQEGKESQHLWQGEKVCIYYTLQLDRNRNVYPYGINIALMIYRYDGVLCTRIATDYFLKRKLSYEELKCGCLEITSLMLCEGDYIIDAALADDSGRTYDYLAHLIDFHVSASWNKGTGVVALDNKWKFGINQQEK